MAKSEGQLVVLQSFVGNIDGADVLFRAGETNDAFFGEPKASQHTVEQATAAPGEKRGA